MSLQLPHNSGCGMKTIELFFSLKIENWCRLISFSVISSPHHLTLYCTNLSHMWPRVTPEGNLGWMTEELDW